MDAAERRLRASGEAAEWLLRLLDGGMTREERVQYVAWLRESPLHVAEMLRASGVHQRLAEFPEWRLIKPADPSEFAASSIVPMSNIRQGDSPEALANRRFRWKWAGAVAAGVAALCVTLFYLAQYAPHAYETGDGERRLVRLSDGSVVRLSPRTMLRVHYTDREREVTLTRGDAVFQVAKNPARPFIVLTDHTQVRAVGTAFGVERDNGSVVVTVEEGRVAVVHSGEETRAPTIQPVPVTEVSLGANQQVIVPPVGPIGMVRKVDSRRALSWAEGRLIFDGDAVAIAVRQFNRFNRVQIELLDTGLASRELNAVFDASDPEAFVVFLEATTNIRVTRPSPDRIVIEPEGPN
jgi:transmembrane sensor